MSFNPNTPININSNSTGAFVVRNGSDVFSVDTTNLNVQIDGNLIIDSTDNSPFLIRKNSGGANVFKVDTVSDITTIDTQVIIDHTSTQSLLLRKNSGGATVFAFNTSTDFFDCKAQIGLQFASTEALRISHPTGDVLNLVVDTTNSQVRIPTTTVSTSTTTGVLVVAGGVGISKDVFIGGGLNVGTILPLITNTYNLGSGTFQWANIFSQNAVTVSDKRKKENISQERFGLDFINNLKPVEFNYKSNGAKAHGLLSQDIEELLISQGVNTQEFYSKEQDENDENDYNYHINYTHLIAPLIKAIQELSEKVNKLEKINDNLQN